MHNEYFYRAINKYGWNCFQHDILFKNLTEDEACKIEIELIAKFNTQNPLYGYNIQSGGNHCLHTQESKNKMRLNNTKIRSVVCYDKEFRSVGECATYYSIHENSLRDWIKGRTAMPKFFYEGKLRYADEQPYYKKVITKTFPIICDGVTFESISKCAEYYGVSRTMMSRWLLNPQTMPIQFQELNLRYGDIYRYLYCLSDSIN